MIQLPGSSGNIVAAESIVVECMNEKPRPSLCFVTGIGKSVESGISRS
ncbi:MAG: hypothetical protein ACI8UO_004948, partial [Verrucomicrobiales bacterium]